MTFFMYLNESIVSSQSFELVGRRDKGESGELWNFSGDFLRETLSSVQAGADRGAAGRQHVDAGKGRLDSLDACNISNND